MTESQKYDRLMLVFEHLADGKDLTYRIANESGLAVGSKTSIGEILADITFVSRKVFDADDVEVVKKALKDAGKRYPGDVISECVAVMLGLKR
jgi:hypothetical protein